MFEYYDKNEPNRAYAYDLANIEVLDEFTTSTSTGLTESAMGPLPVAKLLINFEKRYDPGVKILDTSQTDQHQRQIDQSNLDSNSYKLQAEDTRDVIDPTLDSYDRDLRTARRWLANVERRGGDASAPRAELKRIQDERQAYLDYKQQAIDSNPYGIANDRQVGFDVAVRMFNDLNTDPANAELMHRAAALAQAVGVKLAYIDYMPSRYGGMYYSEGQMLLPLSMVYNPKGNDTAHAILHQIIDEAVSISSGVPIKTATQRRLQRELAYRQETADLHRRILNLQFDDVTLQKNYDYVAQSTPKNPYGRRISQRLPDTRFVFADAFGNLALHRGGRLALVALVKYDGYVVV